MIVNKSSIRFLNLSSPTIGEIDVDEITQKVRANNLQLIEDPTDSYKWKKSLIEKAKHSLEISGYCGGKPFKKFLDIIEQKLQKNPDFIVRIVTNNNTINDNERYKIKELEKHYPDNFQVVFAKAVWGMFPKLMRHENHTKLLIADQQVFISGGTGITNRLLPQGEVFKAGGKCAFLSDGNRDIDLMGEGNIAEVMKEQFDKIWKKWKLLRGKKENPKLDRGKNLDQVSSQDRIQLSLNSSDVEIQDCELIFSHPEEGKKNAGKQTYINLIDQAESKIFLSNMVFAHPKIINALENAIRRGVDVTVVTNGDSDKTSFAGRSIGPRNRLYYSEMLTAAKGKNAGELHIYEFEEKDILLHTKVMVVDPRTEGVEPKVVIGSFNISRESTTCDDELLIVVRSKFIADKTLKRIDFFIKKSKEITEVFMTTAGFRFSLAKGFVLNKILKNVLN